MKLKIWTIQDEKSWKKIFDMNFDVAHYALPFEEKKIKQYFGS